MFSHIEKEAIDDEKLLDDGLIVQAQHFLKFFEVFQYSTNMGPAYENFMAEIWKEDFANQKCESIVEETKNCNYKEVSNRNIERNVFKHKMLIKENPRIFQNIEQKNFQKQKIEKKSVVAENKIWLDSGKCSQNGRFDYNESHISQAHGDYGDLSSNTSSDDEYEQTPKHMTLTGTIGYKPENCRRKSRFNPEEVMGKEIEVIHKKMRSRFMYYQIKSSLEAAIIKDMLGHKTSPKDPHFPLSLKKLINIAKVMLSNPKLLLMDDDSFSVTGNPNLMQDVFIELEDTTIISVCKNFSNLLYFDRVIVMNDGFIVEQGDPKELIMNPNSYLQLAMKNLEHRLYMLINQYLDEGRSVIHIFKLLFNVPNWLKFKNILELQDGKAQDESDNELQDGSEHGSEYGSENGSIHDSKHGSGYG